MRNDSSRCNTHLTHAFLFLTIALQDIPVVYVFLFPSPPPSLSHAFRQCTLSSNDPFCPHPTLPVPDIRDCKLPSLSSNVALISPSPPHLSLGLQTSSFMVDPIGKRGPRLCGHQPCTSQGLSFISFFLCSSPQVSSWVLFSLAGIFFLFVLFAILLRFYRLCALLLCLFGGPVWALLLFLVPCQRPVADRTVRLFLEYIASSGIDLETEGWLQIQGFCNWGLGCCFVAFFPLSSFFFLA